jgi:hypothetical protein
MRRHRGAAIDGGRSTGRRRTAIVMLAAVGVGLGVPAGAVADSIVLGAAAYAPNGSGFGTAEPGEIFNGGVPSGRVERIRWRGWGHAVARGTGRTPIYRPEGGYYRELGRIELRASGRGHCPGAAGQRAYKRLRARVVSRPGGKLGKWFSWSGTATICSFETR